jgi:hypothetical protein
MGCAIRVQASVEGGGVKRPPPQTFRVQLNAHQVARWTIPARTVTTPAADAEHAREIVVRMAHRAAGCPAWGPLVRESLGYARTA